MTIDPGHLALLISLITVVSSLLSLRLKASVTEVKRLDTKQAEYEERLERQARDCLERERILLERVEALEEDNRKLHLALLQAQLEIERYRGNQASLG